MKPVLTVSSGGHSTSFQQPFAPARLGVGTQLATARDPEIHAPPARACWVKVGTDMYEVSVFIQGAKVWQLLAPEHFFTPDNTASVRAMLRDHFGAVESAHSAPFASA